MRSAERRKVNVLEMSVRVFWLECARMGRVKNEEDHRSWNRKWSFYSRNWARGKNGEYRMARRVLIAEVEGGYDRGIPRLSWMDGVKVALGNRGMAVEAARRCTKDRKKWRALLHM